MLGLVMVNKAGILRSLDIVIYLYLSKPILSLPPLSLVPLHN